MKEILPNPEKLYHQLINHYSILTTLRIHQVQEEQGGVISESLEVIPASEASSKNIEKIKDYMAKRTFFIIAGLVAMVFIYLFLTV
ncbi:MAG: hypothetical protein ACFFCS_27985 [Candidatus Hodarchaeota archaeon]